MVPISLPISVNQRVRRTPRHNAFWAPLPSNFSNYKLKLYGVIHWCSSSKTYSCVLPIHTLARLWPYLSNHRYFARLLLLPSSYLRSYLYYVVENESCLDGLHTPLISRFVLTHCCITADPSQLLGFDSSFSFHRPISQGLLNVPHHILHRISDRLC